MLRYPFYLLVSVLVRWSLFERLSNFNLSLLYMNNAAVQSGAVSCSHVQHNVRTGVVLCRGANDKLNNGLFRSDFYSACFRWRCLSYRRISYLATPR